MWKTEWTTIIIHQRVLVSGIYSSVIVEKLAFAILYLLKKE